MPAVVPSPDQLPIFEELVTAPPTRPRPHLRIQPPLLADLTARQRKAVTHGDGPLLIVAGAGTGKTTVITRRIAWLIAEKRAKPSEILALTFTDRAALEMTERVDRLVPYGYTDTVINTFHAFGDRLLREHALEAGLSDRATVLSRAEQIIFLREHLFDLPLDRYRPLGDPTRFLHALVTLISRARDEDVTPGGYQAAADALAARAAADPDDTALAEEAAQQAELAALYIAYERLMRENERLDFGDQVSLALRVLREHPAVLAAERDRYRYILVDEFQDTNYAQFELVKLLAASPRANVTVVGDDDQSIYRFRGAALSNILGFRAAYPKAASVVLNDNFRSRQPILDAAHRLIRHNDPDRLESREGLDKRLVARAKFSRPHTTDGPMELLAFDTGSDEADAVADRIAASLRGGRSAGDHAILVRTNRDAEPILRALNMVRVPWRFSGTAGLYHQPEVRLLVSFLRATNDPSDSVSCYDLATSEIFGLDAREVTVALNSAGRRRVPLEQALRETVERGERPFAGRAAETVGRLLSSLDQHRAMSTERGSGELLYHFITASGWLGRLAREAREGGEERIANVARFFEIVRRQAGLLRDDRLPFMVSQLDTLIEAGDDPSTADVEPDTGEAVHVLTYHKAKGLEFPVVHMVGLVDDRFPTRSRGDLLPLPGELVREPLPDGDHHLAEERRLFYVGMTRAREELYLSWARDYGNRTARRMSQYVMEALDLPPATPTEVLRPSTVERLARHQRAATPVKGVTAAPSLGDRQLSLSYGQISDYLDCPTRYRYAHVIRIPTPASHQMAYGRALHAAVQAYHRRQLAGAAMTAEELLAELDASWESVGFLTRQHEEARKAAAREALQRFWEEQQREPARPVAVEQEFSVLLGRDRVRGRYDRVDREADGRVVITDYKSSDVRDPATAARRSRDSLQLSLYALAYESQHGRLPDDLALHFLESGIVGHSSPSPKRLARAAEQVTTVSDGIRAGNFAPNPSPMRCGFCPFREICPDAAR
ncbi:MAG TPA: ATP-dependent DNA helicase [Candidatus Limnocylindria bacterium]|nr:ATP-dependent DNA helicase [Candidatus Limnocylindria bacterium]